MEMFIVSAPCFPHVSSHRSRSAANRAARKWERDNDLARGVASVMRYEYWADYGHDDDECVDYDYEDVDYD